MTSSIFPFASPSEVHASSFARGTFGRTSSNADITARGFSGNGGNHGGIISLGRKGPAGPAKPRMKSPLEFACDLTPVMLFNNTPGVQACVALAVIRSQADPAAPVPSPAQQAETVARDYIRTLSMPAPKPRMSAPQGICGARHSVELGVPSSVSFAPEQTSFGPLKATAHGRFVVDWGDGTKETFAMGSGENATISHVWTTAGTYDVTISAQWALDWRLGGFSGVVDGLTTSGAVDDWAVIEAQAVIIR